MPALINSQTTDQCDLQCRRHLGEQCRRHLGAAPLHKLTSLQLLTSTVQFVYFFTGALKHCAQTIPAAKRLHDSRQYYGHTYTCALPECDTHLLETGSPGMKNEAGSTRCNNRLSGLVR